MRSFWLPRFSEEYPHEYFRRIGRRIFGCKVSAGDVYTAVVVCTNCGEIHIEDDAECPNV